MYERLQTASYYGSAQVGHLYFLGSALQTPQRTSAIVILIAGKEGFVILEDQMDAT
jgi:hypothetical protein